MLWKITNEYDEDGILAGHWHRIETKILAGFDHTAFYRRFSEALPDWAFIYFGPRDPFNHAGVPFVLNKGKELLFIKPVASAQ